MKQRILAALTALVLTLGLLPAAWAAEAEEASPDASVTVSFALRGDAVHGGDGHTSYAVWLAPESYTLPQASTAADLLAAAMDRHGFSAESGSGYVTAVIWDGAALSELDNGPCSGWMFTVNGVYTSTGMTDTVLQSGDAVEWRYVDDFTKEVVWNSDGTGTPSGEEDAAEGSASFTDVPEDAWYAEAAETMASAGLLAGYGDGTFRPGNPVTRGQMALILYRLADTPAAGDGAVFSDSADWCGSALNWLAQTGIAQGYGQSRFGTSDPLTREQLAVLLFRYAGFAGLDTSASADLSEFADHGGVLDAGAMAWAVGAGLLKGRDNGLLAPGEPVTRAEAAVVLQRFLGAAVR